MKTRSKRLKREQPDIWDLWEAKGFTLPPNDELCRLSRGDQAETSEQPERQLELFANGGSNHSERSRGVGNRTLA